MNVKACLFLLGVLSACSTEPGLSQTEQSISNYPTTATATQTSLDGYGTFDRGWLFSGGTTSSALFGGATETVYRYNTTTTVTDPIESAGTAWRFDSTNSYASVESPNHYNVTPASGFTFVTLMRLNTSTLDTPQSIWWIADAASDDNVTANLGVTYYDGNLTFTAEEWAWTYGGGYATVAAPTGVWMVVAGVVDSDSIRVAVHPFSGSPAVSSNNSVSWDGNVISDCVGRPDFHMPDGVDADNDQSFDMKGFWMGRGTTGALDTNLAAATQEFYDTLVSVPSSPACGDGFVNQTSEQCDDNNTTNSDGCSSTCQVEDILPPTITNIVVTKLSNYQFTISWTTNEASTTKVRFVAPNALATYNNTSLVTSHTSGIFQGQRNKTYTYYVASTDAANNQTELGPYMYTATN